MYYLTDFPNYQDEFQYTDSVVVAAGVNDITRKYLTPETISDVVIPHIRKICGKYANTTFIVSTILLTLCHKTNRYIMGLNRLLRLALADITNVHIFDSHRIMCDYSQDFKHSHKSVYLERHGVGIHLSQDAVMHINNQLATYLRSFPAQHTRSHATSGVR